MKNGPKKSRFSGFWSYWKTKHYSYCCIISMFWQICTASVHNKQFSETINILFILIPEYGQPNVSLLSWLFPRKPMIRVIVQYFPAHVLTTNNRQLRACWGIVGNQSNIGHGHPTNHVHQRLYKYQSHVCVSFDDLMPGILCFFFQILPVPIAIRGGWGGGGGKDYSHM